MPSKGRISRHLTATASSVRSGARGEGDGEQRGGAATPPQQGGCMSEQRPWLWTWWQWQSGSQADAAPGWSLNLVEQSEGEDEPEDTVFHTLAIGAPGGVSVDLGRVSRHPKLERGFASRPPNYTWWMHTNYGTWEVCYRDP